MKPLKLIFGFDLFIPIHDELNLAASDELFCSLTVRFLCYYYFFKQCRRNEESSCERYLLQVDIELENLSEKCFWYLSKF